MAKNPTIGPDDTPVSVIVWPEDEKEMMFIPGGTFIMGSDSGDPTHQPEHQVAGRPGDLGDHG